MADELIGFGALGNKKRFADQGDGSHAERVSLAAADLTTLAAAIATELAGLEITGTVDLGADGTPVPVSEPDTAAASAGEAVNISAADHTCSATTRALYVGGGGDVTATVGGVDLTFKDVPPGTILPIAATVIKDESTATYMVALW